MAEPIGPKKCELSHDPCSVSKQVTVDQKWKIVLKQILTYDFQKFTDLNRKMGKAFW